MFRCLGVWGVQEVSVFWCFRLMTFWNFKRVTKTGGVKVQHFGPPLRPKKVLLTAEKVESAQN